MIEGRFEVITIVIVNWNAGALLSECLASIVDYHGGDVGAVIVVDNGSTDDSLAALDLFQELPFSLKVIKNGRNLGFSAACNRGAALALTEYLLFLNPDTRLFANSLSIPLDYMQMPENARVGIAGIQLLDESSEVARSCGRFPTLGMFAAHIFSVNRLRPFRHVTMHMAEWGHDSIRYVNQVIGAFFFIRRTLFEEVGQFDERFFVYFEELDLSLRIHKHGYRSIYLANAQAFHVGGGTSQQVKAHRLFYSLRSRLLYGFKHFSPIRAWTLLLLTILIEPLTRSLLALLRRSASDLRNTWRAYGMLYRALPQILSLRRLP